MFNTIPYILTYIIKIQNHPYKLGNIIINFKEIIIINTNYIEVTKYKK